MTNADRIVELWRQDMTYSEIASDIGVTRSVVAGVINRARTKLGADVIPARKTAARPVALRPKRRVELAPRSQPHQDGEVAPGPPISMMEHEEWMCRELASTEPPLYCSRRREVGSSYCGEHRLKNTRRPTR